MIRSFNGERVMVCRCAIWCVPLTRLTREVLWCVLLTRDALWCVPLTKDVLWCIDVCYGAIIYSTYCASTYVMVRYSERGVILSFVVSYGAV